MSVFVFLVVSDDTNDSHPPSRKFPVALVGLLPPKDYDFWDYVQEIRSSEPNIQIILMELERVV
jgi:hypothetical protein